MNIGIIGAGEMGRVLARKLKQAGHTVFIANSRGPSSLKEVAESTGAKPVTLEEAVINQKVVIISIPQKNIPDLSKNLFHNLTSEIAVIDTGNYYPNLRDGEIQTLNESGIDSLWVQQELGVAITKAFNAILATSLDTLGKPKNSKMRIALPLSGDNTDNKRIVSMLIEELGFDAFDLGGIKESWKQQPGSPIYCRDLTLEEMKSRLSSLELSGPSMHSNILIKRKADEVLMKTDYAAYLKALKLPYSS